MTRKDQFLRGLEARDTGAVISTRGKIRKTKPRGGIRFFPPTISQKEMT